MPATLQRIPAPPSTRKNDAPAPEVRTLIDQLLAEQKSLQTPVARFAEIHDRIPDLEPHYRTLIPLTKPGSDEQYAFEVSLDRCTGCKACVSACHSLNGLDDHEAWRDTGTLLGGGESPGWQQTITTACHHCEDPGCMNGCPVGAYEKDRDTGIVRHLDDQCIGCSYCILKCPYDVPKYSKKRGIVRKCDMCHNRLAEGEAPACVQACPTEAIRIVSVPKTAPRSLFPSPADQSSITSSTITRPTTRYVGRDMPASAHAADRDALIPQHAHWPLVFMLVLTQAGIGLIVSGAFQSQAALLTGTVLFNLGMIAATLHLGQPLKAWRFFLGLRTSWLSREILAFSLFAPIPIVLCGLSLLPLLPVSIPAFLSDYIPLFALVTACSALPVGIIAIFTSVMIYQDTHRSLWNFRRTSIRFFGTLITFAALGNLFAHPGSLNAILIFAAAIVAKLIPELLFLRHRHTDAWSPDRLSARLQMGPLSQVFRSRMLLAAIAIALAFIHPGLAMAFLLVAEIQERQLFFQSVQAPKMPGNFGPKRFH